MPIWLHAYLDFIFNSYFLVCDSVLIYCHVFIFLALKITLYLHCFLSLLYTGFTTFHGTVFASGRTIGLNSHAVCVSILNGVVLKIFLADVLSLCTNI